MEPTAAVRAGQQNAFGYFVFGRLSARSPLVYRDFGKIDPITQMMRPCSIGAGRSRLSFWPSEFSQVRGQYRRIGSAIPIRRRTSCCSNWCFRSVCTARTRSRGSSMRAHPLPSWAFAMVGLWPLTALGQGKLNVMTTTEDLASIASEVGGDRVASSRWRRGYQDPHFVEAKPSFILKLQKADVFVAVGRDLEIGWLPALIHAKPQREDSAGRDRDPWMPR